MLLVNGLLITGFEQEGEGAGASLEKIAKKMQKSLADVE